MKNDLKKNQKTKNNAALSNCFAAIDGKKEGLLRKPNKDIRGLIAMSDIFKHERHKEIFATTVVPVFIRLFDLSDRKAKKLILTLLKAEIEKFLRELRREDWALFDDGMVPRFLKQLSEHFQGYCNRAKENIRRKWMDKIDCEDIRFTFSDFEFDPWRDV